MSDDNLIGEPTVEIVGRPTRYELAWEIVGVLGKAGPMGDPEATRLRYYALYGAALVVFLDAAAGHQDAFEQNLEAFCHGLKHTTVKADPTHQSDEQLPVVFNIVDGDDGPA